ncbi:MAG: hypothetical protein BGP13_10120 [Sphingobacteriales bacterium 40-81]|nr:MAG: hypothetical protein BGP13_10120 [Sphingobacteriales bacterium 40-81]
MKKIFLLALFFISFTFGFSQSFMHGAGAGVFVAKASNADANAAFVLTYSPRVNFVETEALSVSIGIPFSVGFSGSYNYDYNSYYGGSETNTLNFMFNAPAIINLNVGAGSTKENEKRFGFFVGGGFGYHYGTYAQKYIDGDYISYEEKYGGSYGPAGNIGLRFAVGSHQKNIEARLSYMKAISESKTAVYGIAALFNF